MKLKLVNNYKQLIKKAWSLRFIAIAGLLSGLEIVFQFVDFGLPAGVFSALAGLTTCFAFVSRLVAQKDFEEIKKEVLE